MELARHKKYFEFDEMDTGAGLALRNIVASPLLQHKEKFSNAHESSPDIEASESSGDSEEPEEEIVEDFKDNEEARDDEDFIVLGTPKQKKKGEKRIAKSSSKQSVSRKRKCEFCGTMETPMWRRGPTGKGTLCNACGVKWSLKFRKRTGKKAKVDKSKDDAGLREPRHSTRKKVPSKKVTGESKEENSPQDSSAGFCCTHLRNKRQSDESREETEDSPVLKKRRDNSVASGDEDSLSDGETDDFRLLGRLLNVVEHQIIEERQIDLVRRQVNELRGELHSKEKIRQKELEQSRADALQELLDFRKELTIFTSSNIKESQEKLVEAGVQAIAESTKNIRNQMDEIRNGGSNGLGKKFDQLQSELARLQARMDSNFAALREKASNDAIMLEKILSEKEACIRNGLASLKKSSEIEFLDMTQRLDKMEEAL